MDPDRIGHWRIPTRAPVAPLVSTDSSYRGRFSRIGRDFFAKQRVQLRAKQRALTPPTYSCGWPVDKQGLTFITKPTYNTPVLQTKLNDSHFNDKPKDEIGT